MWAHWAEQGQTKSVTETGLGGTTVTHAMLPDGRTRSAGPATACTEGRQYKYYKKKASLG